MVPVESKISPLAKPFREKARDGVCRLASNFGKAFVFGALCMVFGLLVSNVFGSIAGILLSIGIAILTISAACFSVCTAAYLVIQIVLFLRFSLGAMMLFIMGAGLSVSMIICGTYPLKMLGIMGVLFHVVLFFAYLLEQDPRWQ